MSKSIVLLKQKVHEDHYKVHFQQLSFFKDHSLEFVSVINSSLINVPELTTYFNDPEVLKEIQGIIVTSQRAVEGLKLIIDNVSGSKESFLKKKIFAVGPATFNKLNDLGFQNILGKESGNAIELSNIILNNIKPKEKLIFLTGIIHKDVIPSILHQHDITLTEKFIYTTEPNLNSFNKFLQLQNIDWLVLFATQGIKDILNHVIDYKPNIKIASIGPTTASWVFENYGIMPHIIANKPSPESLFEEILKFEENQ